MMFLDDFVTKLVAGGISASSIFTTSRGIIPISGDGPFIHLIATGGSGPDWTQNKTGPSTLRPACQVMVTALSSTACEARARAAYDILAVIRNTTINGHFYVSVVPLQEPYDFQVDNIGRARWVFNVAVEKRP